MRKNFLSVVLLSAASRGALVIAATAASVAHAAPAVYFNDNLVAGENTFLATAAAADAAYNAAHPGATQNSTIFRIDLTNTTGSSFSVTDALTNTTVYVRTTRNGVLAPNNTTGDAGGDGFTGWSVAYTPGDFASAIAAGYTMSFFSDSSYSTPYLINAIGLNVSDWGTCCTLGNTTPNGGTADASQIYMQFNGSSPLLVGGISSPISGQEHFIAAIDDRNAFSSVTMVPNGRGEYFGAGGILTFSTLQLNSVPANSSVVTVGTPPPSTASNIDSVLDYGPDDVNTGVVNPVFDGGTLRLNQDGAITPDITITNLGGSIDTNGHDTVISGNITDAAGASGALIKTGAGVLTLEGSNTYSGGTNVLDGTLRGNTASLQGTIQNQAQLEFTQATDGTFSGQISGTGSLSKTGTGALILASAQAFTGTTDITAGTLVLTGTGSIASSSNVIVDGTLDISGTANGATVQTISGNGAVALGARTLTLANGGTFGGLINGSGGIELASGSTTFTGSNAYGGGTVIDGTATLLLAGDGNIGSGGVTVNGVLNIAGKTNGETVQSLTGGGTIALGNQSLTIANGGNFVGAIGGAGTVRFAGGTTVISGANNYSGGTNVATGASLVVTGAGQIGSGALTVDGQFDIASSNAGASARTLSGTGAITLGSHSLTVSGGGSFGGSIAGTGGLTVSGGTLALSGTNSFTGVLAIDGAQLSIANSASLGRGAITLGSGILQATADLATGLPVSLTSASSIVDTTTHNVTLAGAVTGGGTLNKFGAGTLTLAGPVSARGIDVQQGRLVMLTQPTASPDGDIYLRQGTSLVAGVDMTIAQRLHIAGSNAVIDTGANTVILTGVADGNACLTKTGVGKLNLMAAASNSIGACIQQGTLSFNNVFDGQVTVEANGTAGGSGRINGNVQVMGTLAPGNSPGRLVVQGSVTQMAGSTFSVDVDGATAGIGAGHYDTLALLGANSVYRAAGTLQIKLRGITGDATNSFTPVIGQTFQIVTAEGGVTGTYTTLAQPTQDLPANSRFDVLYGANSITLAVTANSYAKLAAGSTINAVNVGSAVDTVRAAAGAMPATTGSRFAMQLVGLSASQVVGVLHQAAGEIHADSMDVLLRANRLGSAAVSEHLAGIVGDMSDQPIGRRIWGTVTHDGGHVDGNNQAGRYDSRVNGMTMGIDTSIGSGLVAGVGFGYSQSKVDAGSLGNSKVSSYKGFAYANWQRAGSFVNAIVQAGADRYHIDRRVDLTSGSLALSSDPKGASWSADVEAGHRFDIRGVAIVPSAGMAYDSIDRDALTERGDEMVRLNFGDANRNALLGRASVRVSTSVSLGTMVMQPYALAMMTHEFDDRATVLKAGMVGTGFSVGAAAAGTNALKTGAGVELAVSRGVSLRVGYRYTLLQNASANSVDGGLSIRW